MKNPLKQFVIAKSGDFGKDRPENAIKRWIESNGGNYVGGRISPEVTHLICSMDHWRKRSTTGMQPSFLQYTLLLKLVVVVSALRFSMIKIVTYDWLEDCLQARRRKREGPYLLEKVAKKIAKERRGAKRDGQFPQFNVQPGII
jgi:hypothetical protein